MAEDLTIREEDLTPEVRSFLDRERTRASKTARENALREAVSDPTVVEAIKTKLEEEARKSAEEKLLEREQALTAKENRIQAKEMFSNANISSEIVESLLDISLGSDIESTKTRTQKIIDSLNSIQNKTKESVETELKKNLNPPLGTGGSQTKTFAEMNEDERLKLKKEDPQRFSNEIKKLRRI